MRALNAVPDRRSDTVMASITCYIDAEVLREAGVEDLSGYGGGDHPIPDLFVD
jgi:hypothetical protein